MVGVIQAGAHEAPASIPPTVSIRMSSWHVLTPASSRLLAAIASWWKPFRSWAALGFA
jgi:hypothetical protein